MAVPHATRPAEVATPAAAETHAELQHWYGVPMATGQFATVPYTRTIGAADLSTSALIERILKHET